MDRDGPMAGDLIETPRLRLEPFGQQHLSLRYVSWLNDPLVVRYSDQRFRHHTLESCQEYAKSFEGTPHAFWAIIAREETSGHIGNINAYRDLHHDVADVGILLGERDRQGRGYATEAWLAVCDYLLRIVGVRKLTAGTIEVNEPMLRVMNRVGMVADGRRPRQAVWEGREVDLVHAALFRDHWVSRYPRGPFA